MKPAQYDYFAPTSVDEAVQTLNSYDGEAKPLAGGQSLVPLLNLRLSAPRALVDLRRLHALRSGVEENGFLSMGALTTHGEALGNPVVRARLPALAEALRWIGHPAIRNAGTVGGSIAHADPAAELPTVLTLVEGEVSVSGVAGSRRIPAEKLFAGFFTTTLAPDEILTAVHWPLTDVAPGHSTGWGFREVARRHGDFCLVAAAALVAVDPRGCISCARIALAGVGDRPLRLRSTEKILVGEFPGEKELRNAAEAAVGTLRTSTDIHASAEYRQHLAKVLTYQVLADGARRARET